MFTIELRKFELVDPPCECTCFLCGGIFQVLESAELLLVHDGELIAEVCGPCLTLDAEKRANLARRRSVELREAADTLDLLLPTGLTASPSYAEWSAAAALEPQWGEPEPQEDAPQARRA